MKLSKGTIQVLKNFASINTGLLIRPGNIIRTVSETKSSLLVRAEIDETFDTEVRIYDTNRFLSVVGLFEDADLEFGDKSVRISSGDNSILYAYADKSIIKAAPDKDPRANEADVTVEISSDMIERVVKAAAVLGVPCISIVSDGDKISMKAHDIENPSSDHFQVTLGDAPTGDSFSMNFAPQSLNLLPNDYVVEITAKKIVTFKSETVTYWMGAETTSKFTQA